MRGAARLAVRDLGRMAYREAWALQKRLVEGRLAGREPDTLLLVEHDAVVTLGRGTRGGFLAGGARIERDGEGRERLALPGGAHAELLEVERGGQATWHGPGQVVAYPIVLLPEGRRDLHAWMRALEQAAIDALADGGLAAGRREGATGVWIDGARKIASVGVAASRWVTWHGLALNHDPDLSQFAAIQPCGFEAGVMTSVTAELALLGKPRAGEHRAGEARAGEAHAACPSRDDLASRLAARLGERIAERIGPPLSGHAHGAGDANGTADACATGDTCAPGGAGSEAGPA